MFCMGFDVTPEHKLLLHGVLGDFNFHEEMNGFISETLRASFVNLKAKWSNFASFGPHFELVYN